MKIEHLAIWTNHLEALKDFISGSLEQGLMKNIITHTNNSVLIFFLSAMGQGWN